jgi:hypothetical protein
MNNDLSQTSAKKMSNFSQNAVFTNFKHIVCSYVIITIMMIINIIIIVIVIIIIIIIIIAILQSLFIPWKPVLMAVQK